MGILLSLKGRKLMGLPMAIGSSEEARMSDRSKTRWLTDGVLFVGADAKEIRVENSEEREIPILLTESRKQKRRVLMIRKEAVQIS